MKNLFIIQLLLLSTLVCAQTKDCLEPVHNLFKAMHTADTTLLKSAFFDEQPALRSIVTKRNGTVEREEAFLSGFVSALAKPHPAAWNEKISGTPIVHQDDVLAIVWVPYEFYLGERFSHCGVNVFELIATDEGWKITGITDTRRNTDCRPNLAEREDALNTIMDNWHIAVAQTDSTAYFTPMADNFVFLGTDDGEHWNKAEFTEFAMPFFKKKKAWDFKPVLRRWDYSADGNTAWFDEKLDTWMGRTRGSGVLERQNGVWKITQYNLTITVPNDDMDAVIELLQEREKGR